MPPMPMKTQQPIIRDDDDNRVVRFVPRTSASLPHHPTVPSADHLGDSDLSRYEQPRDEPDDFRQRMFANLAAFAFTVVLLGLGIWLAMSIADMRRTQDCVMMGRRDCAPIAVQGTGS
jgi:hypothetical protein